MILETGPLLLNSLKPIFTNGPFDNLICHILQYVITETVKHLELDDGWNGSNLEPFQGSKYFRSGDLFQETTTRLPASCKTLTCVAFHLDPGHVVWFCVILGYAGKSAASMKREMKNWASASWECHVPRDRSAEAQKISKQCNNGEFHHEATSRISSNKSLSKGESPKCYD